MSGQYLRVFIKPKNKKAAAQFEKFIEYVNAKDFDAIGELDREDLLDEPAHCLDTTLSASTDDGIIRLEFETFTSCAADELFAFFDSLGTKEIEASVYNSQVGATSYFANGSFLDKYSQRKWKWLKAQHENGSGTDAMPALQGTQPLPIQPWHGPAPAAGMQFFTESFNSRRVVPMRRFRFGGCQRVELGNISLPLLLGGRLAFRRFMTDRYVTVDEVTFGDEQVLLQREHLAASAGNAASNDLLLFDENIDGNVMRPAVGVCEIETGHVRAVRDLGASSDNALRVGSCFLLSSDMDVIAADPRTLDEIWRASPGHPANTFAACERTGTVVVVGQEMQVSCMALADGAIRWRTGPEQWGLGEKELRIRPARWIYNSSAHIYNDVVIVMGPDSLLFGLSLEDGRVLWRYRLHEVFDHVSYHPCVAENGKVYAFASGRLSILDALTGAPEIVHQVVDPGVDPSIGPANAAFCDCTDTNFVAVTSHGVAYAIDLATGGVTWLMRLGNAIAPGQPFILCNNRIYFRHSSGCVCVLGGGGFCADR